MKQYWKYIKPYLPAFILGPILMIVEVAGEVFMPMLFRNMTNAAYAFQQGNTAASAANSIIFQNALLMVLISICTLIGGVGGAYFAIKASTNFANDLRKDAFNKIQEYSFENIDKFSTGSLVTRLTNDITQMQNLIAMVLRMALRSPGMLIGGLLAALAMNFELAMIILAVIPVLVIAIVFILRFAFPRFQIMQKKLDSLNSNIQENMINVRVVKSFVREDFEARKFENANHDLRDSSMRAVGIMIATMPIMMLAMNLTTLAVVWFGGKQLISGSIKDPGDVTAFTTYIVQILSSLMMVSMIIMNSSRAMASSKRIKEVLNEKIDLVDWDADNKNQVNSGSLEFKDVCFRYYKNTEAWVLNHISFKAEAGQTVGIIGSTGCGKTTMVSMIPRLYDPDEGEVLVDGKNVKNYSFYNLREGVGMVLQKNVLFSGTIEENLRWGNEEADDAEIAEMAANAQAHKFIKDFTDGYQTELGQGGVNVSGGQKQRLCIARALLKRPKILILDDSTSAVDTATEAMIRHCFRTTLKNTTKLIIAQRISSVMDADKILVMDEGKIVGEGTHDELLLSCHTYREIYDSQMERKEA